MKGSYPKGPAGVYAAFQGGIVFLHVAARFRELSQDTTCSSPLDRIQHFTSIMGTSLLQQVVAKVCDFFHRRSS